MGSWRIVWCPVLLLLSVLHALIFIFRVLIVGTVTCLLVSYACACSQLSEQCFHFEIILAGAAMVYRITTSFTASW